MEYRVDRHGDTTITIRQIKVTNIDRWNRIESVDFLNESTDRGTVKLS